MIAILFASGLCSAVPAEAKRCPQDSIQVGRLCVDKYEASTWETTDAATIKDIRKGKIATELDLAAATERGAEGDDYGAACPDNGADCVNLYAVSMPDARPARFINQIQATAACRNSGKRLLTNSEWTAAALGTPDPGTDNGTSDCNIGNTFDVARTGARASCVSDVGIFDMGGNLWEWVGDWVPASTACPGWGGGFSDDRMCLAGASTGLGPGALRRGGSFSFGPSSGPLAVTGDFEPSNSDEDIGFRCAREL